MKHFIFTLVTSLAFIASASASEPLKIVVSTTDGMETHLDANNLRIHFTESDLVATNSSQNISIPISTIHKLFFSGDSLSIDKITGSSDTDIVEIFNANGIRIESFPSLEEADNSLSKAIYIVKSGSKSYKKILGK